MAKPIHDASASIHLPCLSVDFREEQGVYYLTTLYTSVARLPRPNRPPSLRASTARPYVFLGLHQKRRSFHSAAGQSEVASLFPRVAPKKAELSLRLFSQSFYRLCFVCRLINFCYVFIKKTVNKFGLLPIY